MLLLMIQGKSARLRAKNVQISGHLPLAKAVDEHKAVQACRKGSKHLILFEDVDVYLPIEHDVAGQKQVMLSIIRAANRKTVREIYREIRAAQVQGVTKDLMRFQSLPTLFFKPYLR